ncbi:MAG: FkbM family methyltransferase [Patescibacteria group bacterium]
MKKYFKVNNYLNYFKEKINCLIKYQKTYSQTGEDLILNILLKSKKSGFYVDVGANDPKKNNNTFLFYKNGWSGINIEPNIKKIDLFKKKRKRDLNLNFGIGTANGDLKFYIFNVDTLSTFSKKVANDYVSMGHKILDIKKIKVLSLKSILDKYLNSRNIDFLSVDTEGNDLDVLKSNDWDKYRPNFLIIETLEYKKDDSGKKLNNLYDAYLDNLGYGKIAETYINTIYYDKNR